MVDFCIGHTGLGTSVILSKFEYSFSELFYFLNHISRTEISKNYTKVPPVKTALHLKVQER